MKDLPEEYIIYFNREVHKLLPDQPSREQFYKKLDTIKSVEETKYIIDLLITSDFEFREFKNFVSLIQNNSFNTRLKLFYIEISLADYHWIKLRSFSELFNEVTNYYAFKSIEYNLSNKEHNLLTVEFVGMLKNEIERIKEKIISTEISYSDLKRYYFIFDKNYQSSYKTELRNFLFKYWKYSEITLGALPNKRFLESYKTDFYNKPREIDKITCKIYHTSKGYINIDSNRFEKKPNNSEFSYSNKYLDIWKQVYKDNLTQKDNYREIYYQIIDEVSKPNVREHLICENCFSVLDFEKTTTIKIPEDQVYLCTNCYLERYFERI